MRMNYTVEYLDRNDDLVHEITPWSTVEEAYARRTWLIVNGLTTVGQSRVWEHDGKTKRRYPDE